MTDLLDYQREWLRTGDAVIMSTIYKSAALGPTWIYAAEAVAYLHAWPARGGAAESSMRLSSASVVALAGAS